MADTEQDQAQEQEQYVVKDGVLYVGLVLAHPLSKEQAENVQAKDAKAYKVGQTVYVTREWGNAMVSGGWVQVDPQDKKAVREALLLNNRDQPLRRSELAARVAATAAAAEQEGGEDGSKPEPDAATPAAVEAPKSAAKTK